MRMSDWTTAEIPDQSGRIAVVTGANSGLGLVTARELARAGATVVATARDERKAAAAQGAIAAHAPEAKLEPRILDLASLESVRDFAAALVADHPRIDLLVNNAGVMMPPRSETADGFELQFGTNHLGHFALTGLLLDALAAGEASRVVTVVEPRAPAGQARFRRPPVRAQLLAPRRLPAVEVRQRRLRARARPAAARRGTADRERARPPRLLGHQPPEHRPDRPDEGGARGRQPPLRPERRARRAAAALRGDRARGRERRSSSAPTASSRRAAARPSCSRSAAPATPRPGARLWEVSEELTGVSLPERLRRPA